MKRKNLFYVLPLVLAVHGAFAGTNLINDGGFENGVLQWSSSKSILSLDPAAAYTGQDGMRIISAYGWCPYGAIYPLDTSRLHNGTLYEFGARVRLANNAGSFANLTMGLIKNGADPVWLDGDQSSYDGGVYPDRWTRLFGVHKANFAATDTVQVCISGKANQAFWVDDVFASPLTTAEIGYQAPASLDANALIQADANRLAMGVNKAPVTLKGINLYLYDNGYDTGKGTAQINYQYKNADANSYKEISELGFNTVRLMLSYLLFEDDAAPGVLKDEGWAVLERHIQWAKQYNVRLILDMHEPPGGYQSASGFKNFGSRADLKQRLENLWVAIAQRYRNETAIVAYDLINEPYVNNWFAYAQTLIDKIRTVDTNHLVIVEESFHGSDIGMYKLADNNVLYDIHYYEPWSWAGSHTNNTPYIGTLASFKQSLKNLLPTSFYNVGTDSFNVPLNIGEYGVTFEKYELAGVNGVQWLTDANAAFDHYGISRQLFAYNESNFGIYRGWNSYVGEHTKTTQALKAALPGINGTVAPPPPPPPPVVNTTDLSLSLTHDVAAPTVGQLLTFTVKASNLGTLASDAAVTLPLLASMQVNSVDAGCSSAGTSVICQQSALAGGAQKSWGIRVKFKSAGSAQVLASVASSVSDSNSANNQASDSVTVTAPPTTTANADLALTTFKASNISPSKGTAVGFNFVLINNGNNVASNTRFVLPLPSNMAWVSGASECSASSTQVTCSFGNLAKGVSRNRNVYLRPSVAGSVRVTANVLSDTADSNTANNSKSVTLTVK
jgi:uncharacterized repeat protein (TIGR01451 family)